MPRKGPGLQMSIQAARRPALVERGSEGAKDAGSRKYTDRSAELDKTAAAKPNVPLSNRRRDNWMPLLKIAEVAGGEWPKRVLAAATAKEEAAGSRLEELLSDIRDVFDQLGRDRISSAELIEKLCEIPGRPWAEFGKSGKPLTQNKLARLLRERGPEARGCPRAGKARAGSPGLWAPCCHHGGSPSLKWWIATC
jgi:Protein of unknown function (DUF3631)